MNNPPQAFSLTESARSPARIHSVLAAVFMAIFVPAAPAEWTIISSKPLGSPAEGILVIESSCRDGDASARVTAIVFNEKQATLRVVDSPSPGSATLENTLRHAGVPAGVNGGYFHPDHKPIGLVVANGDAIHAYEKAKLLTGIVGAKTDGRISIIRSTAYQKKPVTYRDAIQCGPMLVEDSTSVAGLNAERIARRTAVATGSGGNVALVYTTSVTLADAANILSLPNIFGTWSPTSALNLDGGTSSGLWANNVVSLPEIKRVRNFLGVVSRD